LHEAGLFEKTQWRGMMPTLQEVIEEYEAGIDSVRESMKAWLPTRPECVQKLAAKYPCDMFYRLPPDHICDNHSDHRDAIVSIRSYFEGGEVGIIVLYKPHKPDEEGVCTHTIKPEYLTPVTIEELKMMRGN
jgi:hypothetical protein